jgi:hypothetical protein
VNFGKDALNALAGCFVRVFYVVFHQAARLERSKKQLSVTHPLQVTH